MTLLVTGASGFVGQGLLAFLNGRGIGGIATGRSAPDSLPELWRGATRSDGLQGLTASAVDAIVHLEVKQHVPRPTPADVADFERVNVGGTREWLKWAARQGVSRFVFLSSIKAVGPGSGPMPEDSPAEHSSPAEHV